MRLENKCLLIAISLAVALSFSIISVTANTNYTCSVDNQTLVIRKDIEVITDGVSETFNITEIHDCVWNCSSYFGRARCDPDPFTGWIFVVLLLIGIFILIKYFMSGRWYV